MIKKPVTLSDALQSHDETMIRRVKVVSVDGSMAYVRPINSNAGFDVQVSGSVAVGDVVDMQIVHGSRTVIGGTNSNVAVSSSATTVINTISQSISSTFSNLTGDVTSVGTLTTIATGVIVAADLANGTLTDVQVATANKDGIAGTPSLRTLGVGAQQAAAGNDSRLSDARTPLAHSTSHKAGGSDEIATTTPAAGAIPKADGAGKIDAWVTHPLASDPSITAGRVANVGTAITFMRSDATPIIGDSDKVDGFNASVTPTAGTIPVSDASGLIDGWVTPNPQGATPTGLAGTTAVAGTAATFIRSDGAPAINPAIAPTWTGVHTFANTVQTQSLIPLSADKYDIGSVTNNYRTVFATNISATVFIENTAQLFGGYLIVPKSVGSFPAVTGTGTTTINFGRNMTTGDIVVVRGVDVNGTFRTEYMRIGAVTTTSLIAGSPWMPALQAAATPINATYTVARDLKSSGGPWSFPKDTPFAIMGSTGDGRVEIESVGSDGPRISMTKLLDSTVTPPTEEEFFRVGDLNGLPNFITGSGNMGANVQGMYFGNSSGYMGYSAGSLVVSGKITAGSGAIGGWTIGATKLSGTGVDLNSGASAGLAFGATPPTSATAGTGIWLDRTGLYGLNAGTYQAKFDATGKLIAGAGAVTLDSSGMSITSIASSLGPNRLKFTTTFGSTIELYCNTVLAGSSRAFMQVRPDMTNGSVGQLNINTSATTSGGVAVPVSILLSSNDVTYSNSITMSVPNSSGVQSTGFTLGITSIGLAVAGSVNINQGSSSGVSTIFYLDGTGQSALTASTESKDVWFNLSRTQTWTAGNITTQRAFFVQAPTYAITGGASTITTAATLAISDAPIAAVSPATTITNAYALWVQAGKVRLDGNFLSTGNPPYPLGDSHIYGAATTLFIESSSTNPALRLGLNAVPVAADTTFGAITTGVNVSGTFTGGARIRFTSHEAWTVGVSTGNYISLDTTPLGGTVQIAKQVIGRRRLVTNNTSTAVASFTIANSSSIGGVIRYSVEVTNGTDYQVETGEATFHCNNKAGVLSGNSTTKFGNIQNMTSGTLTVTWTITAANPAVLTVNCNSSLTPSAGYPRVNYTLENLTGQAVALS